MNPTDPILDPMVHLAFVAAATERMNLGTGIIILPQRNPLVLAKQIASLDAVSGGASSSGSASATSSRRCPPSACRSASGPAAPTTTSPAMRTLVRRGAAQLPRRAHQLRRARRPPAPWRHDPDRHRRQHARAHRRAVEQGHGWYGFFMDPETAGKNVAKLRAAQSSTSVRRSSAIWRSASRPPGRSTPSS